MACAALVFAYVAVVLPDGGPPPPEVDAGPTVLYLNRDDATYTTGAFDDAVTNVASTITRGGPIAGWAYGNASWKVLRDCIRKAYAPYNLKIVEKDPGTTPHLEFHVGGRAQDVGLEGYGGIATYAYGQVVPSGVGFLFSSSYLPEKVDLMCETAVHEIGHLLGLDHAYDCRDFMTYLPACPAYAFVDEDVACGEWDARRCFSGQRKQNSVAILTANLGVAPKGGVKADEDELADDEAAGCAIAAPGARAGGAGLVLGVLATLGGLGALRTSGTRASRRSRRTRP